MSNLVSSMVAGGQIVVTMRSISRCWMALGALAASRGSSINIPAILVALGLPTVRDVMGAASAPWYHPRQNRLRVGSTMADARASSLSSSLSSSSSSSSTQRYTDAIIKQISLAIWSLRINPSAVCKRLAESRQSTVSTLKIKTKPSAFKIANDARKAAMRGDSKRVIDAREKERDATPAEIQRSILMWELDCSRVLLTLWTAGRISLPSADKISTLDAASSIMRDDCQSADPTNLHRVGQFGMTQTPWTWQLAPLAAPAVAWIAGQTNTRQSARVPNILRRRMDSDSESKSKTKLKSVTQNTQSSWTWIPRGWLPDTRRTSVSAPTFEIGRRVTVVFTTRDSESAFLFWSIRQKLPDARVSVLTGRCIASFSPPMTPRINCSRSDTPAVFGDDIEWISHHPDRRAMFETHANASASNIIVCTPKRWGERPLPMRVQQIIFTSSATATSSKLSRRNMSVWLDRRSVSSPVHLQTWSFAHAPNQ